MKRTTTRFHRMLIAPAIAGGMLAALMASPLPAQTTTEKNAPASQQPSQDADGAAARAKLNEQQAQFAASQLAGNLDSQAEYEAQLKAVEEAKARIAADAAAQQAAYDADNARREAEYRAAMEKWRADATACAAGDRSRCAPGG